MSGPDGSVALRPPPGTALFAWVKQVLQEAITHGDFSPEEPFTTERAVVERFGVSKTTAVRALNELVAEGVVVRRRGRGTFVAARGGQRPVASPDEHVLAYVCSGGESGHLAQILTGLAAESSALGYRLVVAHSRDAEDEERVLRRVVDSGAQGLILFPRDGSTAAGTVEDLRRRGVAVAVVDRYFPGLPTDAVIFDDFAIGYQVTTAMLDRGHRALAVLWREADVTSVRDRLSGHYRALRDRGLPEMPERSALRVYDALDPVSRRQRLRSLLDSEESLTGLVCGNAVTLALAASDLLALETGFPGAIELASMDESEPYDVSPLAVASARLPAREMGRTAVRLVHERIQDPARPSRHVVMQADIRVADRGQNRLGVIGAELPEPPGAPPAPGAPAGGPAQALASGPEVLGELVG